VLPPCRKRNSAHDEVQRRLRGLSEEPQSVFRHDSPVSGGETQELGTWIDRAISELGKGYPMLAGHLEFFLYIVPFALSTVRWFRFGIVAVFLGLRLVVFAIILLPAFLRLTYAYFHDTRIRRRIRFGPQQRNYLDIYCPKEAEAAQEGEGPKVPVVVAVMGGAWIMGHRAWNAQLGIRLMDVGVLVVAVDYRNFPLGRVPEMVEDVGRGLGWAFDNVEAYGGDSTNMMMISQSAGAHLGAMLILERSVMEVRNENLGAEAVSLSWSVRNLKCFMGISGPYNLVALEPHLVSRGIYSRILYHLSVDGDLTGCSPALILESEEWKSMGEKASDRLPPIYLFHGDADKSVPVWSTAQFARRLKAVGVNKVTTDIRKGMSHTYPVIEGPMLGHDPQVEVVLPHLLGGRSKEQLDVLQKNQPMLPPYVIRLASHICPY